MTPRGFRYTDFAHRIDVDAFEEAIGFVGEDDGKGNDVGHCPDPWGLHKHGDSTGKFAIHREKKVFNCWVCGGGSLLSLAMATQELSEEETVEWIKQFAGEQTDERFEDEIEDLLRDELAREPVTPWFNEMVLDRNIPHPDEEEFWTYLKQRGIDGKIAATHKVGYNDAEVKISKKGRYEGPGIVFPHFWQGQLVGWQIRWLESDSERPAWVQKYHNTRDFPKKYTIYDLERWYLADDPIVVCESVPTALRLQSLGYASVATFGSTVPPEQFKLLRRCQQGIILAPDADKAGDEFVQKAVKYELDRYVDVKITERVGEPESGNDLADLESDKEVMEVVDGAMDITMIF